MAFLSMGRIFIEVAFLFLSFFTLIFSKKRFFKTISYLKNNLRYYEWKNVQSKKDSTPMYFVDNIDTLG